MKQQQQQNQRKTATYRRKGLFSLCKEFLLFTEQDDFYLLSAGFIKSLSAVAHDGENPTGHPDGTNPETSADSQSSWSLNGPVHSPCACAYVCTSVCVWVCVSGAELLLLHQSYCGNTLASWLFPYLQRQLAQAKTVLYSSLTTARVCRDKEFNLISS